MDELVKYIAELDLLATELSEKYEQMQVASKALSAAVDTGKGDFGQLGSRAQEAGQVYKEVHERTVEFVRDAQKHLRAEAQTARKRGVPFVKHDAERSLPKRPEEYSTPQLLETIERVRVGAQALILAVEEFNTLQIQINETLAELRIELARLERLDAKLSDDVEALKGLETRCNDPRELREPLLRDVQTLVDLCRERAEDILETKIGETYAKLKAAFAGLDALQIKTPDDVVTLGGLEARLYTVKAKVADDAVALLEDLEARLERLESCELLLGDLHSFLNNCLDRVKEAKVKLDARIGELVKEAADVLAGIHPDMPEALALVDLLEQRETIEESELVTYVSDLEMSVAEGRNAGPNALKRYEAQIAEDEGYLFTEGREIEQIGTAILAVANLPEQYSGRLWAIGEDVLLRAMLAEFDAKGFYDRLGYPVIARALRAALERSEIVQALGFLDTEFLPPIGDSRADRIHALLCEPTIRDVFEEAGAIGALRLKPEKFDELDAAQHRAMLVLLDHADDLALPIEVRLQWAAMLHNVAPSESEMHRRLSYLFLVTLLRAGCYLSLYYSLKVLGINYPDLWDEPTFRPMLRHVIEQALTLGADGRSFLIDVCMSPETKRLAAGDFGSEFLIASLYHFATVRWGQAVLLTEAWAAWDRLGEQYPTLADVLHRQLQGEHFVSNAALDPAELRDEYGKLLELTADRFKAPGYQGVRLASAIHRWYVEEHMQGWLQRLQSRHLSEGQARQLLTEVSEQQEVKDLVEACPLQHNPPIPAARPIEGRLKDNLNSRLFELLELFRQAIRIRQQLLSQTKGQAIPCDALTEELSHICSRSEAAAWTIDHLLKPNLPFIDELLTVERQ